jgi:hypothetical protein
MIVRGNKPGQINNRRLNGGAPRGWYRINPKITDYVPIEGPIPTLYGLISTWHDADIIQAAIDNCRFHGCSKIWVLDNNSPDECADVAKRSGAEVESYSTDFYDEDLRIHLQNKILKRETLEAKLDDLWWMVLDADEFPAMKDGSPIVKFLATLPAHFTVVGSNYIELYPVEGESYEEGQHPAKCIENGIWKRCVLNNAYQCGHWKHSVVRYLNGNYNTAHFRGNHALAVPRRNIILYEPSKDLVFFHSPFREYETTKRRFQALCDTGRNQWDDEVTQNEGAIKRWRAFEAVYSQRWREVELSHTQVYGRPIVGIALYPWRTLVPELKV